MARPKNRSANAVNAEHARGVTSTTPPSAAVASLPVGPATNDELDQLILEQHRLTNAKLREENRQAKKHVLRHPTTWFGGIAAIVAIGGLTSQYMLISFDLKQANVDLSLAKVEKGKAEADLRDVQGKKDSAENSLKEMRNNLSETTRLLKLSREELGNVLLTGERVASGEPITIRGQVLDDSRTPMEGLPAVDVTVTRNRQVVVKGITGADGRFELKIPSGEPVDLLLEKVGYSIEAFSNLGGAASHTLRTVAWNNDLHLYRSDVIAPPVPPLR